MSEYVKRAAYLQQRTIEDDLKVLVEAGDLYPPERVAQAAVLTRQDLVLLVSLLSDLNTQTQRLRRLVLVGIIVLAVVGIIAAS